MVVQPFQLSLSLYTWLFHMEFSVKKKKKKKKKGKLFNHFYTSTICILLYKQHNFTWNIHTECEKWSSDPEHDMHDAMGGKCRHAWGWGRREVMQSNIPNDYSILKLHYTGAYSQPYLFVHKSNVKEHSHFSLFFAIFPLPLFLKFLIHNITMLDEDVRGYHFLPNRGAMKKLGGHRIFSWEIGGSEKKFRKFLDGCKF